MLNRSSLTNPHAWALRPAWQPAATQEPVGEGGEGRADDSIVAIQTDQGTAIRNGFDDVSLLVPAESAPPGTTFTLTPLYDWQSQATVQGADASTHPMPQMIEVKGAHLYKHWQMDASLDQEQIDQFKKSVLVDVDVSELVDSQVDARSLVVLTRSGADDRWQVVPSDYDPAERHLRAQFDHFSEAAIADGDLLPVQTSGDNLPTIKAFTVSELYGSATVAYDIDTPTGLGGLSPGLGLSYSSQRVDNLFREATVKGNVDRIYTQAGLVGLGWELTGIDQIVRVDGDFSETDDERKRYALTLNGQTVALAKVGNRWGTDPEIFARIIRRPAAAGAPDGFGEWIVTTGDGVTYHFGDLNFEGDRTPSATSETATLYSNGSRHAVRWYLRQVIDLDGNRMRFEYGNEWDWERQGISSEKEEKGEHWYTSQIVPMRIRWSGQGDETMRFEVSFSYAARTDTDIQGTDDRDGTMPWHTGKRLSAVSVNVRHPDDVWRPLHSYALSQSYGDHDGRQRLLLSAITERGEQGGALRTYGFDYEVQGNGLNRTFLKRAENGWGGEITFTYGDADVVCSSGACGDRSLFKLRPVVATSVADGMGNRHRTTYQYGQIDAGDENRGHIANTGYFLGYASATVRTFATDDESTLLREEYIENVCADLNGLVDNPDPRCGRVEIRVVRDGSGKEMQRQLSAWRVHWYQGDGWQANYTGNGDRAAAFYDRGPNHDRVRVYPPMWISLDHQVEAMDGAENRIEYRYETANQADQQFGNVTHLREYADGTFIRQRVTNYYGRSVPYPAPYLVQLPGRARIFDAADGCLAETRTLYADGTDFTAQPLKARPRRTQRAVNGCSETVSISDGSDDWIVDRFTYDRYGNQIRHEVPENESGWQQSWIFDPVYHLFPIEQEVNGEKKTVAIYGVNGPAATSAGGYWGAIQQQCGIDNVCALTSYDQFGRPTRQWNNVSDASTYWTYRAPGEIGSRHVTYLVTEWHTPRCHGNLSRRHYDGLGQLVAEQRTHTNWYLPSAPRPWWPDYDAAEQAACGNQGPGVNEEIHTYYRYDSLGRRTHVSVPKVVPAGRYLTVGINWNGSAHVQAEWDALGRTVRSTAANGATAEHVYQGRTHKVRLLGRDGDPDKWIQWVTYDGMGNLHRIARYDSGGQQEAEIVLSHDALNRLVRFDHALGEASTTIDYDSLGRRRAMEDPDLGYWTYGYDRLGNMTRQTDGCGNTITSTYDNHNRLIRRQANQGVARNTNESCQLEGGDLTATYQYGESGAATGKLTSVSYTDHSYQRSLEYNSAGLVTTETTQIEGAPLPSYTTRFGYDAFLRPVSVTYPDGETVTVDLYGTGSPARLTSDTHGTLIDGTEAGGGISNGVQYDALGRVTALRMAGSEPALWRRQAYYDWATNHANGNGLLREINVGEEGGVANRFRLGYEYDSFANIRTLHESYSGQQPRSLPFEYDDANRLTMAFGDQYSWSGSGTSELFEGRHHNPGPGQLHAVAEVDGTDTYEYDANGNMIVRRKGAASEQLLSWNAQNRLSSLSGSNVDDHYDYAPDGRRVKRISGDRVTFYISTLYEVETQSTAVAQVAATADRSADLSPFNDALNSYLPFVRNRPTFYSKEYGLDDGDDSEELMVVVNPEGESWLQEDLAASADQEASPIPSASAAAAPNLSQAGELLPNPGFETKQSWSAIRSGSFPGTSLWRSSWGTADQHSGAYGYSVSNHIFGSLASAPIPVSAGEQYDLYTYVRGKIDAEDSAGLWMLRIHFYDAKGGALRYKNVYRASTVDDVWSRRGGRFTVPADAVTVQVRLLAQSISGWITFDDIELRKVGGSPNLIANPGFENGTGWNPNPSTLFPATAFARRYWGVGRGRTHSGDSRHYGYTISNHADGTLRSAYLAVTPSASYDFTAHLRGVIDPEEQGGSWHLRVYYYDDQHKEIDTYSDVASGTSLDATWRKEGGRLTVPAGATQVRLMVLAHDLGGWIAVDDVDFRQAGSTVNLAPNAGFESTTDWTPIRYFPGTSLWRRTWGTATARSGKYAYALSNQAYGYIRSAHIPVSAGTEYAVSFHIRGEIDPDDSTNGGWIVRMRFYRDDGSYIGHADADSGTTVSPEWAQHRGTVTAPSNAATMRLDLVGYLFSGWLAYDDLSVQALEQVTKYYYFGTQRVAKQRGSEFRYLHTDHLGSTIMETNLQGAVVTQQRYAPFGKVREGGMVETDYRFTGQKEDASGLHYFNARYYDPEIGQFISPDTIIPDPSNVDDYNRYLYARGNPLKYNDPSGHCPVCLVFAALLFVGGSVAEGPAGGYSDVPANDNGRLAASLAIGDINDFATLATGYDYISQESVPYGSGQWWATAGMAALPVLSGSLVKSARMGIKSATAGRIVNSALPDGLASTFRGHKYTSIVLDDDIILYRAGTSKVDGGEFGQFFSFEAPVSEVQTRVDKAVRPAWPGGAESPVDTVFGFRVPAGTTIHVGEVGYQGEFFLGGTQQVVVETPWNIDGFDLVDQWPIVK